MNYTNLGMLCGAEFGTVIDDKAFYLRIEAKPVVAAIIQAMGWYSIYVGPREDSGRLWFLVPYTEEIDHWITDTIDLLVETRTHRPDYGQLRLLP